MPMSQPIDQQLRPQLARLGFADYWGYLRSPHWQRTRTQYRCSSEPQDCICGETEELQLHHKTYERLGEERLDDLTPLCRRCHAMVHDQVRRGLLGLDMAGFLNEKRSEEYRHRTRVRDARRAKELLGAATKRRARSLAGRLRNCAGQAANAGLDITSRLDEIEQSIAKLDEDLQ